MNNLAANREQAETMRRAGASLIDLAAEFEVSVATASTYERRGNVPPPAARRGSAQSESRDSKIARLNRFGMTPAVLAERFGLKRVHVYVILHKQRKIAA